MNCKRCDEGVKNGFYVCEDGFHAHCRICKGCDEGIKNGQGVG